MKIGIVALSFGKMSRHARFDIINYRLSTYTAAAHELVTAKRPLGQGDEAQCTSNMQAVIVAQHEIACYLNTYHDFDVRVVTNAHATPKGNGLLYLDTQDVINEAFRVFRSEDVREVIVVAHPFLHAWLTRRLITRMGFITHDFRVDRHIGFDSSRDNLQWWCRGRLRFLTYQAIQVAGKAVGKDLHGIGERHESSV